MSLILKIGNKVKNKVKYYYYKINSFVFDGPEPIANATQLEKLRENKSGSYILTNDIKLNNK